MSEQPITKIQQDPIKQTSQTKLLCIPILILVFLAMFIIQGIIKLVNTSIEEHRIYAINIPEEHVFNCNATWNESNNSIKCPAQKIDGTYSKYDKTELRVGYSDINTKDNHFTKEISDYTIDPSLYVTENYDEEKVKNTNLETSITFSLYNTYLSRTMVEKTVHIRYKLTEEDLKLISDRNTEWKKQEAERKALQEKIEAEKKAEAERKAAEEARERAAEEAKERAAAEERRRASQQQTPKYTPAPAYSGGSSTPNRSDNYSPSTGTNTIVSGYCNDGTYVTGNPSARGKANPCYGHKGWRDYQNHSAINPQFFIKQRTVFMQNPIIENILNKISQKYPKIDTILLFGSALDPGWTKKSDIDLYFIDNNINDGRIDLEIDSVKVEIQTDSFNELKTYIEDESGKLLNRNVSTMLANSEILKTESKEQIENLIALARKTLKTPVDYTTEDVKMWIYSVNDYLEKSIKDVERGNIAAFYFDAHFVIQNATELILATNNHYFPQPKNLTHILEIISPEFLKNIEGYELATSLNDKLLSLQKIAKLCNLK